MISCTKFDLNQTISDRKIRLIALINLLIAGTYKLIELTKFHIFVSTFNRYFNINKR